MTQEPQGNYLYTAKYFLVEGDGGISTSAIALLLRAASLEVEPRA
jgi:hypothetical protein